MTSKLYSRSFIMMAFSSLFNMSSFGSFFLFPLFLTHHGGSKADIGMIMGAMALSPVLCRPWISEMVDKIGRKRSYTVGCLMMSVLPLAYLLFRGDLTGFYLPLLLVRLLHGVGLAICFTSVFTYIVDIVPQGRLNEGVGMFGVSGLTGMAMGPFIAEIIIREFGFSHFFFAASAMAALGLMFQLPLPETYVHASHEPSQPFFSLLRRKKILMVAVLAMLFGFGLAGSGGFVAPFAKERQVLFVSLYYISYSGAAVMTRLFGGRLADRTGEERIIPGALLLAGGGLLILLFLGGPFVLILSGLFFGCGHGFLFPCLNTLAVRNEPAEIRGKITGVFTGSIDAGVFAGSIILGFIGEWAGFRALFLVAGLCFVAGLGFYKLQTRGNG
jgi:predicted MFS family arabinose efflux permease